MNNIQIPPAALEAGARAMYLAFTEVNIGDGEDRWDRLLPRYRAEYREQARAAFLAMIEAWPGMNAKAATDHVMLLNSTPALILPLMEKQDAEA